MSGVDGDLRHLFKKHIVGHWISLESGSTSGGIPDSSFCIDGSEGLIEYKQTHAWAVSFRPTQIPMILGRATTGGRIWIAVRRWKRTDGADQLWMVHGRHVVHLARHGLGPTIPGAHCWAGGPKRWDWRAVSELLCSRPSSEVSP